MADLEPQISRPLVSKIEVQGLFGEYDVEVAMAEGGITLLFGTNGVGKSTILRIIDRMLSPGMPLLLSEPIRSAQLTFTDGTWIRFDHESESWTEGLVEVVTATGKIDDPSQIIHNPNFQQWLSRTFTSFSVVDGLIFDSDGDPLSQTMVSRILIRYEAREPNHRRLRTYSPAVGQQRLSRPCRLITSDRLRYMSASHNRWPSFIQSRLNPLGETRLHSGNTVQSIASALKDMIKNAREASRSKTSDIDASFFNRALPTLANPQPLEPSQRSDLIGELERLHQRLSDCALATSQLVLPSLTQNSPAVQTIFDLYLQDLFDKARATAEILTQLELFVNTMNEQLIDKTASLHAEDGLRLTRNTDKQVLPLDRLSSGEQHLIVLFYYLIFQTQAGGVCLIDEPEISLNVDWQHRFISNVIKVSGVAPQQYIIATHSPVVIREHQELLRPVERRGDVAS